jgi:hypothetical protein
VSSLPLTCFGIDRGQHLDHRCSELKNARHFVGGVLGEWQCTPNAAMQSTVYALMQDINMPYLRAKTPQFTNQPQDAVFSNIIFLPYNGPSLPDPSPD